MDEASEHYRYDWTAREQLRGLKSVHKPDYDALGPSLPGHEEAGPNHQMTSDPFILRPGFAGYPITMDEQSVRFLLGRLRTFPAMLAAEGKTPFLHLESYGESMPLPILDVTLLMFESADAEALVLGLDMKISDLILSMRQAQSFEYLLSAVQALIIALILWFSSYDIKQSNLAHSALRTLSRWTFMLWQHAPSAMPSSYTRRRAWHFAESVRRTIIISHMVLTLSSVVQNGYAIHTVFVEALPIDMRTLLWDSPPGVIWELEYENCPMLSYREYTSKFEEGELGELDVFETMILVACKGVESVRASLRSPCLEYW